MITIVIIIVVVWLRKAEKSMNVEWSALFSQKKRNELLLLYNFRIRYGCFTILIAFHLYINWGIIFTIFMCILNISDDKKFTGINSAYICIKLLWIRAFRLHQEVNENVKFTVCVWDREKIIKIPLTCHIHMPPSTYRINCWKS